MEYNNVKRLKQVQDQLSALRLKRDDIQAEADCKIHAINLKREALRIERSSLMEAIAV